MVKRIVPVVHRMPVKTFSKLLGYFEVAGITVVQHACLHTYHASDIVVSFGAGGRRTIKTHIDMDSALNALQATYAQCICIDDSKPSATSLFLHLVNTTDMFDKDFQQLIDDFGEKYLCAGVMSLQAYFAKHGTVENKATKAMQQKNKTVKENIADLAAGKVYIDFTGKKLDSEKSIEILNKVLKRAFPSDPAKAIGNCGYYGRSDINPEMWAAHSSINSEVKSLAVNHFYGELSKETANKVVSALSNFADALIEISYEHNIAKLGRGAVALKWNKGDDITELREVLKKAFPDYTVTEATGDAAYYTAKANVWMGINMHPQIPALSIHSFMKSKAPKHKEGGYIPKEKDAVSVSRAMVNAQPFSPFLADMSADINCTLSNSYNAVSGYFFKIPENNKVGIILDGTRDQSVMEHFRLAAPNEKPDAYLDFTRAIYESNCIKPA